jgi:hypothetical protein
MGLHGVTPIPYLRTSFFSSKTKLKAIPILGGLHNRYQRSVKGPVSFNEPKPFLWLKLTFL